MELEYDEFGNLGHRIFEMSWEEFKELFGYNEKRRWLLEGMELAISDFKKIGCKAFYADGSLVTSKEEPGDYDICWDDTGMELLKAWQKCPELFDIGRNGQKIKDRYRGDVVPANNCPDPDSGINFVAYFMKDQEDRKKGIIRVEIE